MLFLFFPPKFFCGTHDQYHQNEEKANVVISSKRRNENAQRH
jgi:hypothetical protein